MLLCVDVIQKVRFNKNFWWNCDFFALDFKSFSNGKKRFFFQFWYGVSNNHLDDPLNFLDHGDFWEKLPHWLPCCYSNPLEIPSQGTLSRFTSLATMGLVVDHSKSSTNSWFSMVGLLKELRANKDKKSRALPHQKQKLRWIRKKIRLGRDYDGIDDLKSQSLAENWSTPKS